MARPYTDPRKIAGTMADAAMARAGISKAAGAGAVRDQLVNTYLPVADAIVKAFTPLAEGLGAGDGSLGGIGKQIEDIGRKLGRVAEQERLRREAEAEQQATMAEKMAGRPARPQFRDVTPGDVAKLQLLMTRIAQVDGEFAARLQQEHGNGGPAAGGAAG